MSPESERTCRRDDFAAMSVRPVRRRPTLNIGGGDHAVRELYDAIIQMNTRMNEMTQLMEQRMDEMNESLWRMSHRIEVIEDHVLYKEKQKM